MLVELDPKGRFAVTTPFQYAPVMQRVPDKKAWEGKTKRWIVTPSRVNVEYLRKELPQLFWDAAARDLADRVLAAGTPPPKVSVEDHPFVDPPPYAHQREGFSRCRDARVYALLMEQRTGKTRIVIDKASDQFLRGLVDLVLVICPNSVKSNWVLDEIPAWTPKSVPVEAILYKASERKEVTRRLKEWRGKTLQYLVVNCECLSTQTGEDWLTSVLTGRKVLGVVDEASRFKSPKSSRSKALLRLRKLCPTRMIATGTLITQGPLDAYVPFAWLDPAILGYSNFYSFRNDYALLGGYMGRSVIGYVNTDRLADLIAPFSYRVTRDQCFDMPPKVYSKVTVELAEEQRRLYEDMKHAMLAELEDPEGVVVPVYDQHGYEVGTRTVRQVTATIILTKMLRLQQITGGFIPKDDGGVLPIPGPNPKLEALLEAVEECRSKVIVWARFRPELALVSNALRNLYGPESVVEFHGGVKEDARTVARRRFQDPADPCRFFVGQTEAGGIGIALHAAHDVIYYSNSFSLESRLQSEDRAQNLEKKTPVGYLDIIAAGTLDGKVLASLRNKKSLADVVNRDTIKEWL